jgi:hypothetical protein
MDYLIKNYIEACKPEVLPFGFKRRKNAFVRVINDVLQNVSIETISSGWACRVDFSIIPLCLRIEKEYISWEAYPHYLKEFELISGTPSDSWEYDKHSEASMDACLREIMRYLTSYLLPFFERATSCETALPEVIRFEKTLNDKWLASRKSSGIEDHADPDAGLNLLDSTKYFMALKNGDYDFALRSRQALLQQHIDSYNSMSERGYLTEEDRLEREEGIAELRSEIDRLEARDTGYFQRLLEENEAYSRENLRTVLG